MPAEVYSAELRATARKMADSGSTHRQIAKALEINRGSVHWILKTDLMRKTTDLSEAKKVAARMAISGAWR